MSHAARVAAAGLAAWLVLAVAAVANGILREGALVPLLGEGPAAVVSILLLVGVILGVAAWLVGGRWRGLPARTLLGIGAAWAAGSMLFEVALGRLVLGVPWSVILAQYDVLAGELWVLAPLAMLLGPALVSLARRAGTRPRRGARRTGRRRGPRRSC